MEAKECDRCGIFYKPYNQKSWEDVNSIYLSQEIKIGEIYKKEKYDLCSHCMRELQKWLEREGEA